MPWDLPGNSFRVYIHIRIAFYHSTHWIIRTQWDFYHSQLRFGIVIVIWFLPMDFTFFMAHTRNNNANQPASQPASHSFRIALCRSLPSHTHTPTSTNDCEYIFFIDHFLNFIAEHCKVALLSSSKHTFSETVCLSVWHECMLEMEVLVTTRFTYTTHMLLWPPPPPPSPWFIHFEFHWARKQNVHTHTIYMHKYLAHSPMICVVVIVFTNKVNFSIENLAFEAIKCHNKCELRRE